MADTYLYRSDVMAALEQYGIKPTAKTPPELARGFVRDLYCYELRILRDRMIRREFPKQEYADRVIRLRDNYRVLSLRAHQWVTSRDSGPGTKDHREGESD